MNAKTVKLLQRISKATGIDMKRLKKGWYGMDHVARGKLRKSATNLMS